MLTTPKKYFFHRRYAWITWPGIITPLITWHSPPFALLGLVSLYHRIRIHWLWPHEERWLACVAAKTQEQDTGAAIALLDKRPVFTGYTARLRAQQRRVRVLIEAGREHEAQQVLFSIDTLAMTEEEKGEYQALLAIYYEQTGDIKAFLDEVATWGKPQVLASTERTLLKARALLEESDLVAAHECLTAGIDQATEPVELRKLYNDLAVISGLAGRPLQQLGYLETAWQHWRKAPDPEAMHSLAHNLAMSKLDAGQQAEAKKIVNQAYTRLDRHNPQQVLMWHNLYIEVARDMGDRQWLYQTRTSLDKHFKALTLTISQRISLAVSRLRMDYNDGLVDSYVEHLSQINELLDNIHQMDEKEQLPALKAISHSLDQLIASSSTTSPLINTVIDTLERCDRMVRKRASLITQQLQTLPPRLINQRQHWLSLQHHLHKVQIRSEKGYPRQAMHNLIQSQQESAELYQEKGAIRLALQAWTVVCDEYVAYMQQFTPEMKAQLQQQYLPRAVYALQQADTMLVQRHHTAGLEEYIIALAYFWLQLGQNQERARYWVERFDQSGVGLNHYAAWLREEYFWVKGVLGSGIN